MSDMPEKELTADDIRRIAGLLKANDRTKTCKKCGAKVVEFVANPEAAVALEAAGYDGSCCWEGFPR